MQDINHLVMAADEGLIYSGRFHDIQCECSDEIGSPFAIGRRLSVVASKHHGQRTPREVVGDMWIATYRDVTAPDAIRRIAIETVRALVMIELRTLSYRKATDGIDLDSSVLRVTDVDLEESEVGTLHNRLIHPR